MTLYDTVFGTQHAAEIRQRYRQRLEEEFINIDGSIVALRSFLTGHAVPFPMPDSTLVRMLNPIFPDLAERYWAIARHEVLAKLQGGKMCLEISGKGYDIGNFKPGHLMKIDGILGAAREMGDVEAAEAALSAFEEFAGRSEQDGVLHYQGSNLLNLMTAESHMSVTGGMTDAIRTKPHSSVITGPILNEATYPDVLVARAVSPSGNDLDLMLQPGLNAGSEQRLGLERLNVGKRYQVEGALERTGLWLREYQIVTEADWPGGRP